MLYTGQFYSKRDSVHYQVDIQSGSVTTPEEITFTDDVCVINTSSKSLFSPIKSRGITISILSKDYHFDLYEPTARGTSIVVRDITDSNNIKVVFRGYLTPCAYDQSWSYVDSIELNGVDALSTTKEYKWSGQMVNYTFFDIIKSILHNAGYRGSLIVPRSYTYINSNTPVTEILKQLSVNGSNFYDDDDEKTPWKEYEVLEELMKFLGWSMSPDGDDVWLLDYRYIANGGTDYFKYDLYDTSNNTAVPYSSDGLFTDVSDVRASGNSKISIDDIYNKIEISDNLYKVDEICPDIFDTDNLYSVTQERVENGGEIGLGSSQWTITTVKYFLWWETSRDVDIPGYNYQTFFRMKENTGWKHRYYKKSDLTEYTDVPSQAGTGYYYPGSSNTYTRHNINRYINTIGCLVQKYAYRANEGANNLPSSIDWVKCLTFFISDDSTPTKNIVHLDNTELPVLEYETGESINWKPTTGTSWITIKGDMYYQYNGASYGDKGKDTLTIINTDQKMYTTCPVDKAINIDGRPYMGLKRTYEAFKDTTYGEGFRLWKMKLQIGDKYWNGSAWQNAETTFYINYNNNPSDRGDEYIAAFQWMSVASNVTYKDKVGVDGYCIPIAYDDNSAPNSGTLKLTIYVPSVVSPDLIDLYKRSYTNLYGAISWLNYAPVIYVKDFEVGYVYTDTSVWYIDDDVSNDDKVYTGLIDLNNVKEFDSLELKVNTSQDERPISRSYVVLTDGGYLKTLKHKYGDSDKEQEYNIIDMYLDHHSDRKVIYNTHIHNNYSPETKFEYSLLDGVFLIDSQSYSLEEDNNKIKLIQF